MALTQKSKLRPLTVGSHLPGELAERTQGGLVGGDRPLAPGELPEQLVGLEELGPLAMQTVEALAIEGLKIQTDMTDQEAPYQVTSRLKWNTASKLCDL